MQIVLFVLACNSHDDGGRSTDSDTVGTAPWTDDTGGDDGAGGVDTSSGMDTAGSGSGSGSGSGTVVAPDDDLDGWGADVDCNDQDAAVHPSAPETCNGIDDDCDAVVDDGLPVYTSYTDADGDGYGGGSGTASCTIPAGSSIWGGDCNDADAGVSPGRGEACNAVDDDCDAMIDDGLTTYASYADADGDGYGSGSATVSCAIPAGSSTSGGDCDDADATISPGRAEMCNSVDDDCDAMIDDGLTTYTTYSDGDGDAYGSGAATVSCAIPAGSSTSGGDCDDADATVSPGRSETCNTVDDDCDGTIDDGLTTYASYSDGDGDGYGSGTATVSCAIPAGSSAWGGDCDDADATVSPGRSETCNTIDDDCDGTIDDGLATYTSYTDADGDGYGTGLATVSCTSVAGAASVGGDCDDGDATVSPGRSETCNTVDDDCDGTIDDGLTTYTSYADSDGDGYGRGGGMVSCSVPAGSSTSRGDCDDADATVSPGRAETCNGVDDDCNATIDDGLATYTSYTDADGDGYGTGLATVSCTSVAGAASVGGDCDDADATVSPGRSETCNTVDDDCDGTIDDGLATYTSYTDADGDGYGRGGGTVSCSVPAGSSTSRGDCDDADATVSPGRSETCNTVDDDCDGTIDDGLTTYTSYSDADGDGYGTGLATVSCTSVPGAASVGGDCDDAASSVHPGATEICNDDTDSDCDGDAGPACRLDGANDLVDGDWSIVGDDANHELGAYVHIDGDLDGDGAADLLVIAPNATGTVGATTMAGGAVYAFFGASAGPVAHGSDASVSWLALPSGELEYGAALAHDVDGDGHDDLAIGVPGYSSDDGMVALYYGPLSAGTAISSKDLLTGGVEVFWNSAAVSHVGGNLVPAGDVDDDGFDDLWIAATWVDDGTTTYAGATFLLTGPVTGGMELSSSAHAALFGDDNNDGFYHTTAAGDLNSDGFSDVVLGAPNDLVGTTRPGAVYVFYGPMAGDMTTASADAAIEGTDANDRVGWALEVAPDQDGDGYPEVLVGASQADATATESGAAYLWNGDFRAGSTTDPSSADATWNGVDAYQRAGSSVATGDFDGDGAPDFAIGAAGSSSSSTPGAVYVSYGPVSGTVDIDTADASFLGETANDYAGYSIAAGDVNADGKDDLFVGAQGFDDAARGDAGRAYLWLGLGL